MQLQNLAIATRKTVYSAVWFCFLLSLLESKMPLVCNAPFCDNPRNKNHAWCPVHRWEREKYKVKPYKELLPFWCGKRCPFHGLIKINDTTFRKNGSTVCRLCVNSNYNPSTQKKYQKKYKRRQTNWRLEKRYGISVDFFEKLLFSQGHRCAICLIHIEEHKANKTKDVNFAVDHCHSTGLIRGLLCYKCNMGLGYFNDNPELTQSATNYLTKN
jgi:hypothetical protein